MEGKMFLARNIGSKEGSLAKAFYDEQIDMGWPGLASDCENICEEIGLKKHSWRGKGQGSNWGQCILL